MSYYALTPSNIRVLRRYAADSFPEEACGYISPDGTIHRVKNIARDRRKQFDMVIPSGMVAIWHTHPRGRVTPSEVDLPCMKQLAENGIDIDYLIVTMDHVYHYDLSTSAA